MTNVIFNSKKQRLKTKDSHFPEMFFGKRKPRPKYRVEAVSNDQTIGNATRSGVYDRGNVIKLEAMAFEDSEFIEWLDGNKNNVRWIEVLEDIELTAQFQKKTKKGHCLLFSKQRLCQPIIGVGIDFSRNNF